MNIITVSGGYLESKEISSQIPPLCLTDGVTLEMLPTYHNVFKKFDTGVGLVFHVSNSNCNAKRMIVISGDTGWTESIRKSYCKIEKTEKMDADKTIFIPHISTVNKGEIPLYLEKQKLHSTHLCIAGLCEAIEAVKPDTVLLSEIGEELDSVIDELAEIVKDVYGLDECKWYRKGEIYPLF